MEQSVEDNVEDIVTRLERPIVLIGLMGVGKTKIGRSLADRMNVPFVDSDDEIEMAAGMSINDIFEKFGEEYFRDGERRVIRRLIETYEKGVIATGGGAVMAEETADIIWEKSISIWLRADLSIMIDRTKKSDKRPLLKNKNAEEVFSKLIEERYPVYGKANLTVESHEGPTEDVLKNMIDKLQGYVMSLTE